MEQEAQEVLNRLGAQFTAAQKSILINDRRTVTSRNRTHYTAIAAFW